MRQTWLRIFLIAGFCSATLWTQQAREWAPTPSDVAASDASAESQLVLIQSVIDTSNTMPPEISAHLRIQAATVLTGLGVEQRKRSEVLLEEAFQLAAHARFPTRLEPVNPQSTAMRSVEGAQLMSLVYGLDGLSLQAEVVETLANWNPEKAVALLEEIPIPRSHTPSCVEFQVPDVSEYPRLLAKLVQRRQALRPETARALIAWARDTASGFSSVGELPGLIELAESSGWTAEERNDLFELAGAAITRLPTSAQTPWRQLDAAQRFILGLDVTGAGRTLRSAWADYLKRQELAQGCPEERGEERRLADSARIRLMIAAIADGMVVPTRGSPTTLYVSQRPSQSVGSDGYDVRMLFESKAANKLFLSNPGLRASERDARLPKPTVPQTGQGTEALAAKLAEEKLRDFQSYVEGLAAYRQDADIHSEGAFHEICEMWQLAVADAPDAQRAAEQAAAFGAYLDATPMRQVDPPSWHRYALRLLNTVERRVNDAARTKGSRPTVLPASILVLRAIRPLSSEVVPRASINRERKAIGKAEGRR